MLDWRFPVLLASLCWLLLSGGLGVGIGQSQCLPGRLRQTGLPYLLHLLAIVIAGDGSTDEIT